MSESVEYEVRNRLSSAQVDDLVRLYGNEWWSTTRTRADVERMLQCSDGFTEQVGRSRLMRRSSDPILVETAAAHS